jgi:hypothetical protein
MNPCVKTGVDFRVQGESGYRTGDLFYNYETGWQIKGIPQSIVAKPINHDCDVDIVISALEAKQRNAWYYDTDPGLQILWVSDKFTRHIEHYYPELMELIPTGE